MNGEHEEIKARLHKAEAEFKEFERKDIKYRCMGVMGWVGGQYLAWRGMGGGARLAECVRGDRPWLGVRS